MNTKLEYFLGGAILMASWAVAVFFYRFARTTGDRLFHFFAAAFFLLGFERVCRGFLPSLVQPYVYLIRLLAFLLILFAIWDKNRAERKS